MDKTTRQQGASSYHNFIYFHREAKRWNECGRKKALIDDNEETMGGAQEEGGMTSRKHRPR